MSETRNLRDADALLHLVLTVHNVVGDDAKGTFESVLQEVASYLARPAPARDAGLREALREIRLMAATGQLQRPDFATIVRLCDAALAATAQEGECPLCGKPSPDNAVHSECHAYEQWRADQYGDAMAAQEGE